MTARIINYGIVYLLTNPAMPGLVKIGMTTREDVDMRMRELFGTGVPVPFECEYACRVNVKDCSRVEKALHLAFQPYRINPQREFFKINPEQAIAILKLLDKSSDITQEISEEINNDLSEMDKVAGEKLKRSRRPPLNFVEMGIPIGSILQYGGDDVTIEIEVCAPRKVIYNGKETSLTAVIRDVLNLNHDVQPTPYWYYKGRNLSDIYDDTYTFEEE